jgi:aspartyl-tRNA(Asn)/glutamyl-tRNA(Gln) amidotransferase subunit C
VRVHLPGVEFCWPNGAAPAPTMGNMSDRISSAQVTAVANLARLRLSESELEQFTAQLGDILDHANDMAQLDLEGVEPTSHPFDLNNVLREDVDRPSLDRDEVLAGAPRAEANMFHVPPVMGEYT